MISYLGNSSLIALARVMGDLYNIILNLVECNFARVVDKGEVDTGHKTLSVETEKGDVIYEQKYIGIGRQFWVFMPIITK